MMRFSFVPGAWALALALVVSAVLPAGPAAAGLFAREQAPGRHSSIPIGREIAAPFGHVSFCVRFPEECRARAGNGARTTPAGALRLDPARHGEMVAVNARVNREIEAISDRTQYSLPDRWQIRVAQGDCEEFALAKQRALLARGWPSSSVLVAIVRRGWGEKHAVLVTRTDHGDFVLDNRIAEVRPWKRTGYRFVAMQSPHHPMSWVAAR